MHSPSSPSTSTPTPDAAGQPHAMPYTADDCRELLECARYGEEDDLADLKRLLEAGVPVDYADDGGNSGLHKACANGHVDIARALMAAGATHAPNASGNTPLHWAVQQGQLGAAQALIIHYADGIDVLAQNSFGKSVVTEAFGKGDASVIELVLSHPSAKKLEPEEEGTADLEAELETAGISTEVTHEFCFTAGAAGEGAAAAEGAERAAEVLVRELAELGSDDPSHVLGSSPEEDRTGLQLWAASLVLSHWLVEMRERVANVPVLELGAGCGLCGIVAAKVCGSGPVILTDLAPRAMDNLAHNLAINELGEPRARAHVLDWRDPTSWPPAQPLVIGADLVYCDEAVPSLVRVVVTLTAPGGAFLYVAPETNRQGEADFLERLVGEGLSCQVSDVPDTYLRNVLIGRDDDEFAALFGELKSRTYRLYCFTAPSS